MTSLKILTNPNPKLREKSTNVDVFDKELEAKANEMLALLRTLPGYGLAAPQVGINKKLIVIENDRPNEDNQPHHERLPLTILVNPEVTKFSKEKCNFEEGCFSVPYYMGDVIRPTKVRVTAQDLKGKKIQINASGIMARVLQHEIDHLNGILFTDYIADKSKLIKKEIGQEWQEAIEKQ